MTNRSNKVQLNVAGILTNESEVEWSLQPKTLRSKPILPIKRRSRRNRSPNADITVRSETENRSVTKSTQKRHMLSLKGSQNHSSNQIDLKSPHTGDIVFMPIKNQEIDFNCLNSIDVDSKV